MLISVALLQNTIMIDRRFRVSFVFACAALSLLGQRPACATLGENAASVTSDANELRGVVHTTWGQQYGIFEIGTGTGVNVREFMSLDGVVFAVAWDGPVPPDLQLLLGTNFAAYSHALSALQQPGLRRSLRVTAPNLVVETDGHLRAYRGRAYLPALLSRAIPLADLR